MNHPPRIREHHFDNGAEIDSVRDGTPHSPATHPFLNQARDAGLTVVSKFEESVRSRPLMSLGLAAGLGILVAFWSKRR